jgi:hypothetical protein
MELKKIVLLPIPTGWRDSNSPMGDGLWLLNGLLQNLSLICYFIHTSSTDTEMYYLRNVFLDIFCCVKWRKLFWYPFQWAGGTPTANIEYKFIPIWRTVSH